MGWRDFVSSTHMEKVEKVEKEALIRLHIPLIPLIPPTALSQKFGTTTASPRIELMGLIKAVGTLYAFTPAEFEEATQVAFADPQTALTSFRDIATRYGLFIPADDRVTCGECLRLVGGRCGAAKQGLMANTQPDYSPVQDVPRHCEHFKRTKYAH